MEPLGLGRYGSLIALKGGPIDEQLTLFAVFSVLNLPCSGQDLVQAIRSALPPNMALANVEKKRRKGDLYITVYLNRVNHEWDDDYLVRIGANLKTELDKVRDMRQGRQNPIRGLKVD